MILIDNGLGPPHHVGDLEILHHQQVISRDELTGLFVVKVLTLVRDLAMTRSDSLPTLVAALRPALCSAQPLLRRSQLVRRCPAPARIVDVLTVTGSGQTRDADIDPNLAAGDRHWIG